MGNIFSCFGSSNNHDSGLGEEKLKNSQKNIPKTAVGKNDACTKPSSSPRPQTLNNGEHCAIRNSYDNEYMKKQQNGKDQNQIEDKNKKESKPVEANAHSSGSSNSRKSQKHGFDETLEDSGQQIDSKSSVQPPKKLTKLDSGVSVEEKTNQNSITSDVRDDKDEKPVPKPIPEPEPEPSTTINRDLVRKKYPYLRNERYDTIAFRQNPEFSFDNEPELDQNLRFYRDEIESQPSGDYLKNIVQEWWGDYYKLERHHGYIQWLFPLGERGLNSESQPLQYHELQEMKKDKIQPKMRKAFKMMLDFYGMEVDKSSRELSIIRTKEYKKRYFNLLNNRHNLLRITRILKCLAIFDMTEEQIKWIEFLASEIFETQKLASLDRSITEYWVHTIRDETKRKQMIQHLEYLISKNVIQPDN